MKSVKTIVNKVVIGAGEALGYCTSVTYAKQEVKSGSGTGMVLSLALLYLPVLSSAVMRSNSSHVTRMALAEGSLQNCTKLTALQTRICDISGRGSSSECRRCKFSGSGTLNKGSLGFGGEGMQRRRPAANSAGRGRSFGL